MLLTPGRGPRPAPATGPLAELYACHARIRSFTELAERLATTTTGVAPGDYAHAARALVRYHVVALPLHAADEDLSLAPRLRAVAPPDEVLAALERMTLEHTELDALLAATLPTWERVAEEPAALETLGSQLAALTHDLRTFWERHLELEERVVFPAALALLSAEALGAIRAEGLRRRHEPAVDANRARG